MNPIWTAGDVSITRIVDLADVPFAAAAIYPDATAAALQRAATRFGAGFIRGGDLLLSFHAFLLRTPKHTILVDTCVGDHKERPTRPPWHRRTGGAFLTALAAAGVQPGDIDFVMCTHLHADHVGWNTQWVDGAWRPTFPRAQYVIAETEYNYWHDRHAADGAVSYGAFADSVLPVAASGQALLVAADHVLANGVALEPAPGHTPGNVVIQVEAAGRNAVLSGDVLHHPIQLLHPEWSTNFCTDPDQSRRTRTAFIRRHADTGTSILPAHFQAPTCGCIIRKDQGHDFAVNNQPP